MAFFFAYGRSYGVGHLKMAGKLVLKSVFTASTFEESRSYGVSCGYAAGKINILFRGNKA